MHCSLLRTIPLCLLLLSGLPLCAQEYRWAHQDSIPNMHYEDVACADSMHCYAIGNDGGLKQTIRRSVDGGRTWKRVYLDSGYLIAPNVPHYPLRMWRVVSPVAGLCLVVCDSGRTIRSTDGGDTWTTIQLPVWSRVFGIMMWDSLQGMCVTVFDSILVTTDAGATWTYRSLSDQTKSESWLGLTCLRGRDEGYLIARSRTVWRTEDRGKTWRAGGKAEGCSRLAFVSADSGWAVGGVRTGVGDQERDVIRRTIDGGKTWQTQIDSVIPRSSGLRSIAFADRFHGLAIGGAGKIHRTDDAGESWVQEWGGFIKNMDPSYTSVAYPATSTAFIVSNEGNILRQEQIVGGVAETGVGAGGVRVIPNPVHDGAGRVAYTMERSGPVRVVVIDALGRRVAVLADGIVETGEHSVALPSGLPAGAYRVRVTGAGSVRGAIMVVVR